MAKLSVGMEVAIISYEGHTAGITKIERQRNDGLWITAGTAGARTWTKSGLAHGGNPKYRSKIVPVTDEHRKQRRIADWRVMLFRYAWHKASADQIEAVAKLMELP